MDEVRAGARGRVLRPAPSSVPQARALVRDELREAGREDLVETASLLVSELVTNAMLHAGTDIELSVFCDDQAALVEVSDGSTHLPVRRRYAATAGTGRGILMLEQMVDAWGVTRRTQGKTVWFRLSTAGTGQSPDRVSPGGTPLEGTRENGAVVKVELGNLPLLLHAAWQEHVEAMLREYLLVKLDAGPPEEAIAVHADANEAIAVLEEHLPRVEVTVEPTQIMRRATHPDMTATVIVPVPVLSVPHFATLDRAIEDALAMARDGVIMTPPTPPEMRAFRVWLCRQVAEQAVGLPPKPWSMTEELDAPSGPPVEWDSAEVTASRAPRFAADETGRVLAVSAALLELLGYDVPEQLVGRRVRTIVPERFHQAHLAVSTLLLLVNQRPLNAAPVVVPVCRRDGSEVRCELKIGVRQARRGRSVLVADLHHLDA